MKNNGNKKAAIIVIGIIGIIIVLKFLINHISIMAYESRVKDYLKNRYTGEFEIVNQYEEEGEYIFQIRTVDEYQISFSVACWLGALSTPWGDDSLFPSIHLYDTFPYHISTYIVDENKVFDVTGKTIDEILDIIYGEYAKMETVYGLYCSYGHPDMKIRLCYKDRIVTYSCSNTTVTQYLAESIYEDLVEPYIEP